MKFPKISIPGNKPGKKIIPESFQKLSMKLPFSFGGGFSKSVLGIEIGEMWLKMAVAQEAAKGAFRLSHTGAEPIQGLSALEVSQKILNFTRQHSVKPSKTLISFPTQHLTTRILSLPSTDPKEIADIVDLQAVKQTPYSREEITSSFRILSSDAAGYSRIFLAIAHRETAAQYFQVTEMALLPPARICPALEGLRLWAEKAVVPALAESEDLTLLLDVDASATEFVILQGTQFKFGRSLAVGGLQLEQGGSAEGDFFREVSRTLEAGGEDFQSSKVTRVVVTGIPEVMKTVAALLSRELSVPCETVSAFEAWGEKVLPQPAEEILGKPVSFSSLTGHLLSTEVSPINLMPPEVKVRRQLEDRAKELALAGTLFLTLVMLGSMIAFEKIYKRTSYLDYLKQEHEAIRGSSEDVEKLVDKMRLAQEQMSGGSGVLEVMNDLNQLVPDSILMTSFQYSSRDKNIILRGVSPEMSAVFQFLTTLEAAPYLEMVKTRNVTKRKTEEQELSEFEIIANIALPKADASAAFSGGQV